MATYWHRHASRFANFCEIARLDGADSDERVRAELSELGYTRITRRDLRKHVAWINAENDAWGSSRAMGHIHFADIVSPMPEHGLHDWDAMREILDQRERARHYREHWGLDN